MSLATNSSPLRWKVFVTPAMPTVHDDLPPGETARIWSPISSVLIHGERDAILVDTPVTTAQATALADWVEKAGKTQSSHESIAVETKPGDLMFRLMPTAARHGP